MALRLGLLAAVAAATVAVATTQALCGDGTQHSFVCIGDLLVECTGEGNSWTPILNCKDLDGQTCSNGTCTYPSIGDGDLCKSEVYCMANEGLFPDLADCQQYHDCSAGTTESFCVRCPRGFAFDQCTRSCSRRLGASGCPPQSAPSCERAGQLGTAPGNQRLYYVCGTDLIPHWGECSSGFFNVANGRCTNWSASGCSPCPMGPGSWPLPNSDCGYLECRSNSSWLERPCSTGWHFDSSAGACVLGPCSQP